MKASITAMLSIFAALAMTQPSQGATAKSTVERDFVVNISDVLIPAGFDSQSDVVAVVSGMFPNSCYRWNRTETTRNTAGALEVKTLATVRSGLCLMVLVPYTREISLGVLGAGSHTVRFVNGDDTYIEKQIVIE